MIYKDSIFGKVSIKDPLVVRIIRNPEFQRLKNILCQGIPDKYYGRKGFSRYHHSVGVYLILRNLNASYEEQIAGLLHDVSHKAFSHVYDWMIKDYTKSGDAEDSQDMLHSSFIKKSALKKVLIEHKLNPNYVFDLNKHKLLDRDIPYLCADRIEYSIRSLSPKFAIKVLKNIKVHKDRIVCTNYKVARDYAYKFLSLQNNEWGSPEAATRYYHFSEILKLAVKNNVLSLKDFDFDDRVLVNKISKSKLKTLTDKLKVLQKTRRIFKKGLLNRKVVYKKFRYIDPEILLKSSRKIIRLSSVDKKFKKSLKESGKKSRAGTVFTPLW